MSSIEFRDERLPPRARRLSVGPHLRGAVRRAALYLIGYRLNPLMIALMRRGLTRFAMLEHRGRRSGRTFMTPVEARRATDGGFIIPLTWGEGTDWFRNVRAAGGCILNWHGRHYTLEKPEVVGGPEARSAFHPVERLLLKVAGVRFVHLQQAPQ